MTGLIQRTVPSACRGAATTQDIALCGDRRVSASASSTPHSACNCDVNCCRREGLCYIIQLTNQSTQHGCKRITCPRSGAARRERCSFCSVDGTRVPTAACCWARLLPFGFTAACQRTRSSLHRSSCGGQLCVPGRADRRRLQLQWRSVPRCVWQSVLRDVHHCHQFHVGLCDAHRHRQPSFGVETQPIGWVHSRPFAAVRSSNVGFEQAPQL